MTKDITIYRFNLSEMTPKRIFQAFDVRFRDLPNLFAWEFGRFSARNKQRLTQFAGKHSGQRCFILGNGPSLGKMDLSPLKNEITFGMNRISLLFDRMPFKPTYFVSVSDLVLQQFRDEIIALPMPKFVNWKQRRLYGEREDVLYVRVTSKIKVFFGDSPLKPLESGSTVTNVAIQLAYFMGFQEVILIGVDHHFVERGIPNSIEMRHTDADQNHFHPEYFPKGIPWQLPDLRHSELAYAKCREVFLADGRNVVDATVGGKCPVFERVEYSKLFSAKPEAETQVTAD